MQIPFSTEEFFAVFVTYNEAVYPVHFLLYAVALSGVFFAIKKTWRSDEFASAVLAGLWFWTGIVYHLVFFTAINSAAYAFGILYIIQGFIFAGGGILKDHLKFDFRWDAYTVTALIMIFYGLVIYPVWTELLGHHFPARPTFGAPCPVTIFTFGILLLTKGRIPIYMAVIPFLWSLVGTSAAINLGVTPDYGLGAVGVIGFAMIIVKNYKIRKAAAEQHANN